MQRSYDARVVALTIGVTPKWVDNLLSQQHLPGVARTRQGVQRRISFEGLVAIELTRLLAADLGLSVARAAELARSATRVRAKPDVSVVVANGITLVLHLDEIAARLRDQVTDAIEAAAPVRRGRPATKSVMLPD